MYDSLRHFADSYALAVMFALFLALCAFPFLPSATDRNNAAARSIFKDDHQDD